MAYIEANGQKIFYEDSGGDGPPLVFLHGFLFDHTMFDAQVQAFRDDYRCICVDTRGFGQTVWDGEAFDLYDVVSDVISLMDQLELDKVTIVGMSQGAYAAVRLAIKHPDRVRAMVLISTRKDITSTEFNENYKGLRNMWVENGPLDPLMDSLMTLLIGSQEEFGQYWDMWRPRWEAFDGNHMYHTINALLSREVLSDDQLRQIEAPIFAVHGQDDLGTPLALAEELYKVLPNVKGKVVVDGAAHAVNMTHANQVNGPIKEFLDEYA